MRRSGGGRGLRGDGGWLGWEEHSLGSERGRRSETQGWVREGRQTGNRDSSDPGSIGNSGKFRWAHNTRNKPWVICAEKPKPRDYHVVETTVWRRMVEEPGYIYCRRWAWWEAGVQTWERWWADGKQVCRRGRDRSQEERAIQGSTGNTRKHWQITAVHPLL